MSTQAHMRNELTSKLQRKHQQFKQLLEYFVAHLEWCNSQGDSSIGYIQYIKPLLDTKKFKYAGQGWNGDQIQKQIER